MGPGIVYFILGWYFASPESFKSWVKLFCDLSHSIQHIPPSIDSSILEVIVGDIIVHAPKI